jgi:hypothetical protein
MLAPARTHASQHVEASPMAPRCQDGEPGCPHRLRTVQKIEQAESRSRHFAPDRILHRPYQGACNVRNAVAHLHSVDLSSDSVVGQRMAMSFAIEHPDRLVDGIIEVVWTVESLVSEMMLLQIAPELFDRIVMVTLCCWFVLRCRSISPARCAAYLPAPIAL